MRWPRLPFLLLGIAVVLGMVLWLVSALYGLYRSIAWTNPFLANLLLWFVLGLTLLLLGVLAYYVWVFRAPPRQVRPRPRVPAQKPEAAIANLRAVRRQVQQIQDQVARQTLMAQTKILAQDFSRRQFQVVVFGVGASGKTSLVNALVGRMVGDVGPTVGTTAVGQSYNCWLPNLERGLLVTDTPGLLEPGVGGTEREQAARQLATDADLLLFVVDSDLTESEYQVLCSLADIGKRLILVFNKTDLYIIDDRALILKRLRDWGREWLWAEDVVAIAANPKPLRLASGQMVQPEPDLLALMQRITTILQLEGDDLLADNLLLQSQRLSHQVRDRIDAERRLKANQVVVRYQWMGAGVIWATPVVIDLLATAAINTQMVIAIAKVYDCELSREQGQTLARSLAKTLGGLGIVKGVMEIFTRALEFSVAGYVVGKTAQSISTAYLTRIAGQSFIEYFRNGQDWGDGGMAEVVQQQFHLNQRDQFVRAFIREAIIQLPETLGEAWKKSTNPSHKVKTPQTPAVEKNLKPD